MSQFNYDEPVDAKSKWWCSDCKEKGWGIWSHRRAHEHHQEAAHRVHLTVPDTEEEKQARRDEIAKLDAEELAAARAAGFESVEAMNAAARASIDQHIRALVIMQNDALRNAPYRTLEEVKAGLEAGTLT